MEQNKTIDKVYAFLTVLLAFLWQRLVFLRPLGGFSLNVVVMTVLTVALFVSYLWNKGIKSWKMLLYLLLIGGVLPFVLFDGGPKLPYLLFCGIAGILITGLCCGRSQPFWGTFLFSVFVRPFAKIASIFTVIFTREKKKGRNTVLWVMLGVFVSIPFMVLLIDLLASSDKLFSVLFQQFIGHAERSVLFTTVRILFCIPLAMYLFGALYGNVQQKPALDKTWDREKLRVIPAGLAYGLLPPLILLFIAYFISQLGYFTSAFSNILPEGFTYAEYARSGFFELCTAGAVTLVFILLLTFFVQQRKGTRVPIVILSSLTLGLFVVAVAKMLLYIGAYQLTAQRLHTLLILAMLAAVFLVIILKTMLPRFPAGKVVVCALLILFAGFMFLNTDGLVARYNVRTYLAGQYDKIDVDSFATMSDDVVPYLYELTTCPDQEVADRARELLLSRKQQRAERMERGEVSFCLSAARAGKIYEKIR